MSFSITIVNSVHNCNDAGLSNWELGIIIGFVSAALVLGVIAIVIVTTVYYYKR